MNIFIVTGIVAVAFIATILLRHASSPFAPVLPLIAAFLVFTIILPQLSELLETVTELASGAGMGVDVLSPVFRGLGILLITKFAAGVCSDNGQKALGETVEYCGQIFVVSLALPMVLELAQKILDAEF